MKRWYVVVCVCLFSNFATANTAFDNKINNELQNIKALFEGQEDYMRTFLFIDEEVKDPLQYTLNKGYNDACRGFTFLAETYLDSNRSEHNEDKKLNAQRAVALTKLTMMIAEGDYLNCGEDDLTRYFRLGEAYFASEEYEMAEKFYEKALKGFNKILPDDSHPLIELLTSKVDIARKRMSEK